MQFLSVTLDANKYYFLNISVEEDQTLPYLVIFNSDGTYNSYKSDSSIEFGVNESERNYYIGVYAKDSDCTYTANLETKKYFGYKYWTTSETSSSSKTDRNGNLYDHHYVAHFSWEELGLNSDYIPIIGDRITINLTLTQIGDYKLNLKTTNFASYDADKDNWFLELTDYKDFGTESYEITKQTKATTSDSLNFNIYLYPYDDDTKDSHKSGIPFDYEISTSVDTTNRKKITVTYNAGENATSSTESEKLYPTENLTATASCENKFFVGWSQTENGDKDSVITVAPDEDCTLYAVFGDELELTPDWNGSRIPFSWFENYENAYLTIYITHDKTTDDNNGSYWCGFGTNWSGNIKEWNQTHKEETTETLKFLVSDLKVFYKNCEINDGDEAALYFSSFNKEDEYHPDKVERVYLTYDSSNLTQCLSRMQDYNISLKIGETYNEVKYFLFPQSLTDNCKFYIYNSDSEFSKTDKCDVISISEENVVTAEKEGYAKCYIKYLDSNNNVLFEKDLYHFTVTSETSTSE